MTFPQELGSSSPAECLELPLSPSLSCDTCLSLALQEIEASMHCSCSCSHNSDYLCTAPGQDAVSDWEGNRGDAPRARQLLSVTLCHGLGTAPELPQAPGKSVTAEKEQFCSIPCLQQCGSHPRLVTAAAGSVSSGRHTRSGF